MAAQIISIIFTIMSLFSGCISSASLKRSSAQNSAESPQKTKRTPLTKAERARLLAIAKTSLGSARLTHDKKSFRSDCSGTIRAIFAKARIGLGGVIKKDGDNDVKTIYRYVKKYGFVVKEKPIAGDLVFFHNTYDRSGTNRMNDALTHIGLVEKIDETTVHFIHHLGRSIIRSRMNLSMPQLTHDPKSKKRINHILRRAQKENRAYTTAELFAGFGRL